MTGHSRDTRRTTPRARRGGLFSLRALVLYLLFVALVSTVSLARYSTTVTGTGTMRVARPAISLTRGTITLNGNTVSDLTDLQNLLPGDVVTCQYTVSNRDAVGRSEVSMRYKLYVENWQANAPLTCTIQKDGQSSYPEWIDFGFSADESHIYTLTITFPVGTYSQDLFNRPVPLNVSLLAEQVDE